MTRGGRSRGWRRGNPRRRRGKRPPEWSPLLAGHRIPRRRRGRGGGNCGLAIADCGLDARASNPQSAIANPQFFSRRSPPLGVQIVLQQHRRRERIHVVLAAPGRPAHRAHGPERARRGEPLVPQLDRLSRAACDVAGERPGGGGGFRLGPVLVERQADHDAGHGVLLEQGEKLAHRKAFAGAAGEGGQRLGEGARFIGEGEADAALAPVDAQQPALASAGRHPCAIVAKNSLFVLVRLSRSSRNSIASTGGMSARKLRSRYTLLSSSLESRISSLRVPDRWTSIAGKVRRSAMRRSRITSMLPVPLNSSKITSSMREPVSIRAVARIVSEPPPSMLRAAPKKRLGFCSAFASTPPDRILPECGTTTLWARPRRVIESSRMTTSLPCSTRRLAFSITMSATWTWRSAGSSNVEEITSTLGPLTFSSMSVTSSGRSSMSSTMR